MSSVVSSTNTNFLNLITAMLHCWPFLCILGLLSHFHQKNVSYCWSGQVIKKQSHNLVEYINNKHAPGMSPKTAPSHGGSTPSSNTWLLRPTRFQNPNTTLTVQPFFCRAHQSHILHVMQSNNKGKVTKCCYFTHSPRSITKDRCEPVRSWPCIKNCEDFCNQFRHCNSIADKIVQIHSFVNHHQHSGDVIS